MSRILIIDDDPVFADMTKQRLERAGHAVTVHVGPFGATKAAGDPAIELILLDVFMPALSGPDLLEIMRKNSAIRVPVLFCSSMDPVPLRKLAVERGASGSISKSSGRSEFIEAVAAALSGTQEGKHHHGV